MQLGNKASGVTITSDSANNQECFFRSNGETDMVIWTTHFTSYGTISPLTATSSISNSGGGGGGGGGGSSRGSSISGPALPSGESVVLYEVSWDTTPDGSKQLHIIAGPDDDAVDVKLRAPASGLINAQRTESQPYSDGQRILFDVTLKPSDNFVVVYVEAASQRTVNMVQKTINLDEDTGSITITEYIQNNASIADKNSGGDDASQDAKVTSAVSGVKTISKINMPQVIIDDFLAHLEMTKPDGNDISDYDYEYIALQTIPDNYARVYHQIKDQYSTTIAAVNAQTGHIDMLLQVSHTDTMVNSARIISLDNDDNIISVSTGQKDKQVTVNTIPITENIVTTDDNNDASSDMRQTRMNLASVLKSDSNFLAKILSHMTIKNESTGEHLKYYTLLQQYIDDNSNYYSIVALPDRYGSTDGANQDLNVILVILHDDTNGVDDVAKSILSIKAAHIGGDILYVTSYGIDIPYCFVS